MSQEEVEEEELLVGPFSGQQQSRLMHTTCGTSQLTPKKSSNTNKDCFENQEATVNELFDRHAKDIPAQEAKWHT